MRADAQTARDAVIVAKERVTIILGECARDPRCAEIARDAWAVLWALRSLEFTTERVLEAARMHDHVIEFRRVEPPAVKNLDTHKA